MAQSSSDLTPEEIRTIRIAKEREWYLSKDGFLDFVRDSGAAPQAQLHPHGVNCRKILTWDKKPDPEAKDQFLYIHKLILWPRGSFKSSVFDIGLVCWEIARNPNIRILVCSETGKQARKFVELSKQIIDSAWYRERFGVHRSKVKWVAGAFTSALRTDRHTKEPTLQAAGVGEVWTGSHWDLVLADDVVSQENTKTPEALVTMENWMGEVMAQLDPGCRLMLIGTLHHYNDLYCSFMRDKYKRSLFDVSIHSWKNDDGTLFFPGRLTTSFIDAQRRILPTRLFACFYENRPMTSDQQLFKPEYFRTIKDEDCPNAVWTYILTDFAFVAEEKKKKKADRTVFWVVSIDCNRVAYVRDFYVGRWKPSDSVRIACDLWNRYQNINMKGILVEDTAHKELLMSLFEEIRRQTFIRPRIISVQGRSQEVKDMRIEAIEPKFRRGDIYFLQSLRLNFQRKWKPLVDEMTEWPFSAHDDIPDAISDLDKQDKDGQFICKAPPVGWRSAMAQNFVPTMIDGRLNPNFGYPAREFVKEVGEDIWRTGSSTEKDNQLHHHNNDLFRRKLN